MSNNLKIPLLLQKIFAHQVGVAKRRILPSDEAYSVVYTTKTIGLTMPLIQYQYQW